MGLTTYLLLIISPTILKQSNLNLHHQLASPKDSNPFSRHGVTETIISNNGPQYASHDFATFASSYNFQHIISSPLFPQSNGQAERTVQTAKRLLKNAEDPYMALLTYRNTPLTWCNLSPTQLLMGRCL